MKKILFSLLVLMFCLTFIQNAQGFAIPVQDEISNKEFSSGESTDSSGVKVDGDLSSLLSGISSSSSSSSSGSLTSSVARVVVAYFSSRYFPVGDDKEKGFTTRAEAAESLSTVTTADSSAEDEEDDENEKLKSVSRPTLNPQAPNDFRDFLFLRNLTATTPPLAWTYQNNEQAHNEEKEMEEREEGAGDGDVIVVVQVQSFYTSSSNNDENNENNRENSLVGLVKDVEIDTTTIPPSTTTMSTPYYISPTNGTTRSTTERPTNGTTRSTTARTMTQDQGEAFFLNTNNNEQGNIMRNIANSKLNVTSTLRSDLKDETTTTQWTTTTESYTVNTTTESYYAVNKTSGLSTVKILRKMFDPRKMDVMYFFGGVASMLAVVGALLVTRKLLYKPVSN